MYARYTEYLKDLMDNPQSAQALQDALSTYPLYQGKKLYDMIPTREQLNTKILNHYKYKEIGFETVGRFLDELRITMEEIMPYYNERFKTVEIMADIEDPFGNIDIVEEYEEERNDSSTGTGTGTSQNTSTSKDDISNITTSNGTSETDGTSTLNSNGKQVKVDTPQDALSISSDGIDTLKYASEANWDKSTSNTTDTRATSDTSETEQTGTTSRTSTDSAESSSSSQTSSQSTVTHTYHKKGNQGVNTYAHDMNEFRTSLIDVVDEIINDQRLAVLFMCVY